MREKISESVLVIYWEFLGVISILLCNTTIVVGECLTRIYIIVILFTIVDISRSSARDFSFNTKGGFPH